MKSLKMGRRNRATDVAHDFLRMDRYKWLHFINEDHKRNVVIHCKWYAPFPLARTEKYT